MIDRARRIRAEGERNDLYRQAERLVLDDQAVVPLSWYTGGIVFGSSVRNFVQSPLLFVAYDEIFLDR